MIQLSQGFDGNRLNERNQEFGHSLQPEITMALDRYGVLSGTLVSHRRDDPDNQGRWFHVNLVVNAANTDYRCAVDVDSHQSSVGVEWRTVQVPAGKVATMLALAEGYHDLQLTPVSGAWDYIRSSIFHVQPGCVFVMAPNALLKFLLSIFEGMINAWNKGSNVQASEALESLLSAGQRILVWGEPFTQGNGMHNVHQNQGDPLGSQWAAENAIWQDGGVLAQQSDGSWIAFISKFSSQAYRTDDGGHPLP